MIRSSNIYTNNKIPEYISKVYTKKKIYDMYLPLSESEINQLNKLDRYMEVYTSNHIEGNSYNEFETRALLDTGVSPSGKPLKDSIEISNLNRAIVYANSYTGDLTEYFIKKIHSIICSGTLDDPDDEGEFKRTRNWVGDINTCPPNAVNKEMSKLMEWYNLNKDKLDSILLATRFKYRFLVIHPFIDGNGRTSRLLFNHLIRGSGLCSIVIRPEDKDMYYKCLKESNVISSESDNKFKCEPLEEFMCECLIKSYEKRIRMLEGDFE